MSHVPNLASAPFSPPCTNEAGTTIAFFFLIRKLRFREVKESVQDYTARGRTGATSHRNFVHNGSVLVVFSPEVHFHLKRSWRPSEF